MGMSNDAAREEHIIVASLKACAKRKDLNTGIRVHDTILKYRLLKKNPYLASSLINMYAKCGALSDAQQVFGELSDRHISSWNVMITGFTLQGQDREALNLYDRMQMECLAPDAVTLTSILKACSGIGAIEKGKSIHHKIVTDGLLQKDVMIGNALLDMYSKCGDIVKAQQLLEELPVRNVISWSALIAGYAHQGQCHKALHCIEQMHCEGLPLDAVSVSCILKACGNTMSIDKGKEIHDEIINLGLLKKECMVGAALVDMYAKCGVLQKAREVFDELPLRETISWNVLISGFVEEGEGYKALNCFRRMQSEGLCPDIVTLTCILKACGSTGSLEIGKQIHNDIFNRYLLEKDEVLGNALVDMYARCGMLVRARQVLLELPVRSEICWSALISGYNKQGFGEEALACFQLMQSEGIYPDVVTYICILKACSSMKAIEKGRYIHDQIIGRGFLKNDIILSTALVDMYVKCGILTKAQQVLDELPKRDIVSWSVLIAGYTQQEHFQDALDCFEEIEKEGLSPTAATFACILKACSNTGAIDKGEKIHEEIVRRGLLETNAVLGSCLVDMYAKCGMLAKALQVFEELPERDTISWSALITGYAREQQGHEALKGVMQMKNEGLALDDTLLLCVMKACSHSGLAGEVQVLFGNMSQIHNITPELEHHTSLISDFGIAGHFDKAISVIEAMPFSDNVELWICLLNACRKWGNLKLAKLAFEKALRIDQSCSVAYTLMIDIFTAAGFLEDAATVEKMRLKYADCSQQENKICSNDHHADPSL